jgi:plastocyanin
MHKTRLFALGLAFAGVTACLDSFVQPASPNQTGLGPSVNNSGSGSGGGGTGSPSRTVTVGDNFFSPDTLTVFVSDTVTWTWVGTNPHSVTFSDGTGSALQVAGTFRRFFGSAGTFTYGSTAIADSLMIGQVTVVTR